MRGAGRSEIVVGRSIKLGDPCRLLIRRHGLTTPGLTVNGGVFKAKLSQPRS